jgi:hypothetical protein
MVHLPEEIKERPRGRLEMKREFDCLNHAFEVDRRAEGWQTAFAAGVSAISVVRVRDRLCEPFVLKPRRIASTLNQPSLIPPIDRHRL